MTRPSVHQLVDEAAAWAPENWWRLELRSFREAAATQRELALLAPREVATSEYRSITAASCLQGLAYIVSFAAPVTAAAAMIRWSLSGTAYDFPLGFAGILTLIALIVTVWSEIQERRHPRAASRSAVRTIAFLHIVPGLVTIAIALGAGERQIIDAGWWWLAVVGVDVLVYVVLTFLALRRTRGPQNPHENVQQSIREIPDAVVRDILSARDAAIARLLDRSLIDAATAARATATRAGELGLTMAPEVGSDYYRPADEERH